MLPYPVLAQRLEDGPELARRSSAERLARASLRLASARRTPPLRPQLGLRRLGATDETAFVAGVSFELPVLDRRQGEIAASRASVSRARAETEAERVRLRSTLFELREELEHELHRAGTLSAEVIPRLDEAVEGARRAYEQGRYGYLDLSSLQSELLEARAELIEASAGAHRLVVALERLTGQRVLQP